MYTGNYFDVMYRYIFFRYGGWENETLVELFADYANVSFAAFGDRVRFGCKIPSYILSAFTFTIHHQVKWWLTFNEPWVTTTLGYDGGVFAPGVKKPGMGAYTTAHTIIKAHAEAWHLYNDVYRPEQGGCPIL